MATEQMLGAWHRRPIHQSPALPNDASLPSACNIHTTQTPENNLLAIYQIKRPLEMICFFTHKVL